MLSGEGDDTLAGNSGTDQLVGGIGADTIEGGEDDDHMWGGEWSGDGASDLFLFSPGSDQDMIHDFEVNHDIIDLSSYGLTWEDVANSVQDHGWAASIELGEFGGEAGDRLFLVNVSADDLSEDNFTFGA